MSQTPDRLAEIIREQQRRYPEVRGLGDSIAVSRIRSAYELGMSDAELREEVGVVLAALDLIAGDGA